MRQQVVPECSALMLWQHESLHTCILLFPSCCRSSVRVAPFGTHSELAAVRIRCVCLHFGLRPLCGTQVAAQAEASQPGILAMDFSCCSHYIHDDSHSIYPVL